MFDYKSVNIYNVRTFYNEKTYIEKFDSSDERRNEYQYEKLKFIEVLIKKFEVDSKKTQILRDSISQAIIPSIYIDNVHIDMRSYEILSSVYLKITKENPQLVLKEMWEEKFNVSVEKTTQDKNFWIWKQDGVFSSTDNGIDLSFLENSNDKILLKLLELK